MMLKPANQNYSPRLGASFDHYCCEIGFGVTPRDLTGRRLHFAAHLDSLPEDALKQMGIAASDIPRIVFRDLFSG